MENPKSMVYRDEKADRYVHVRCAACPPPDLQALMNPPSDGTIPCFYSLKHAADAGWVATKDRMFCDPKYEFVFLCPECAKEFLK